MRLVCGVGVNNVEEPTETRDNNGKRVVDPYYMRWVNMLKRAYDSNYSIRYPSYKDVHVCSNWLLFSNFKAWMETQDWGGKELDKDLLIPDNKMYSPDTCLFVSQHINSIILENNVSRGEFPLGVSFSKDKNKLRVRLKKYGKEVFIGYFITPEEASEAYKTAKNAYIKEVADTQEEPIKSALLQHLI